jgi:hypothetical protein
MVWPLRAAAFFEGRRVLEFPHHVTKGTGVNLFSGKELMEKKCRAVRV